MRPVQLLYERDTFVVVHMCVACRVTRRCRAGPDDNVGALLD